MKFIEVILKVSERCNINCSYCYFFNKENQDWKRRPPVISEDTIDTLANFLCNAAQENQLDFVQIDLHGGEPLVLKHARFRAMCLTLRTRISQVCPVRFSLQTNAMLIDDDWISIFEEFQVYVGVSIDGVKAQNDKFRIDHRGRGTFERAVQGLRQLQLAERERRFNCGYSVLAVVDPSFSAEGWYRLFSKELGVKRLHLLLPDHTHDDFEHPTAVAYGNFLCEIFALWNSDDATRPSIRMFNDTLAVLAGGLDRPLEKMHDHTDSIAFTVASDGELDPADDLRNVAPTYFGTGTSIYSTSFSAFLKSDLFSDIRTKVKAVPSKCQNCAWQAVCYLGPQNSQSPSQRFSRLSEFNNPSVYCAAYQDLFTKISVHLLNAGMPLSKIEASLAVV